MSKKRESHRQALRQLLDLYGVRDGTLPVPLTREDLVEAILGVSTRFNHNPSLDEALNSGDGSYKP